MRIGIVQMSLYPNLQNNTKKILSCIIRASKRKIQLLCFPECALTGYIVDHHKTRMDNVREEISKIQKASNKYGISLVVGTSWSCGNRKYNKKDKTKKIYNAAVIIRPHSKIKLYFKNDLTEFDKKYFSKGNSKVVFNVEGIRCGVLICRDQNNPILAARYKNTDILFYLSSHYYSKLEAIKKERKNKAFPIVRALENKIYVAKADAVGKQNNLIDLGGSMVVSPEGEVIAEAKKGKQDMLEFNL